MRGNLSKVGRGVAATVIAAGLVAASAVSAEAAGAGR